MENSNNDLFRTAFGVLEKRLINQRMTYINIHSIRSVPNWMPQAITEKAFSALPESLL